MTIQRKVGFMRINEDRLVAEISAGAVVYRIINDVPHFVVIHRNKMNDYALPKGHCEVGESLQETASREVLEETGWNVSLTDFIKRTEYEAPDKKTATLYWRNVYWFLAKGNENAQQIHDPNEVDAVDWLSVGDAEARLSYEEEIGVLRAAQKILTEELQEDK